MTAASTLTSLYLMWFARPKCDRALFRRIGTSKPMRIVEIGLGDGSRGQSAILLAQRYTQSPVSYCGIDLFEASPESSPLTLKQAHHKLCRTGAKIRLVPGDPCSALARTANFLIGTDLLIVDHTVSAEQLSKAEDFLPRMLHAETVIATYVTTGGARRIHWKSPTSFSELGRKAA